MKFLICGVGSIGQRHYKNLQSLGHELALFRSRTATTPFIDGFFKSQEEAGRKINVFFDLEKALEMFRPDAVFVTNPNSVHMEVALPAARFGSHLFIEKPVSHNLVGVEELIRLASEKALQLMVGYNLRFHPLLKRMRDMVLAGDIGQPLSAHVEMGENVEDWHSWEDYRKTYSVWKSGGGGVVLCFSHDIDYLYWFFGKPVKICSLGGKLTPHVGDAEDMIKALLEFDKGIVASLHLDYWQRPRTRRFELVGTEGKLVWEHYPSESLTFLPRRRSSDVETFAPPAGFERNDMFVKEVQHFIECLETDREPSISLKQGIEVLEATLEIKSQIGF